MLRISYGLVWHPSNLSSVVDQASLYFLSIFLPRLVVSWAVSIQGCGVDHLIELLLRTTSCCQLPLLHLLSPSTSGSGCCPFEDLPFVFLKLPHSPVCPVCSITLHLCPWGLFCRIPLLSKSGSSGPSLWQLSAVVSPDSPCWMCSALLSYYWAWGFLRKAVLLVDGHLLALY